MKCGIAKQIFLILIFSGISFILQSCGQEPELPSDEAVTEEGIHCKIVPYSDAGTSKSKVVVVNGGSEYGELNWPSVWGGASITWRRIIPSSSGSPDYKVTYNQYNDVGTVWSIESITAEGTYYYSVNLSFWDNTDPKNPVLYNLYSPRGVKLSRVSNDGASSYTILDKAGSYLNVPYVLGICKNQYDEDVSKCIEDGYAGTDCSGLVSCAYNKGAAQAIDVCNTSAAMLQTKYKKTSLTYDDAVSGDMWFVGTTASHVGLYQYPGWMYHASASEFKKVVCVIFEPDNASGFWRSPFGGLGRLPAN